MNISADAPCPGGVANYRLLGVKLLPGNPPIPEVAWCAPIDGNNEVVRRSPISTTTDGIADPIVWFMNGAKLQAFDGKTGQLLNDGRESECLGVHRFTSPIAARGRILVAADGRLCSWSVH
jgi:hypothetical protein